MTEAGAVAPSRASLSQRKLIRASATWGVLTLASRVLGFVREILLARSFGTSLAASQFVVAQTVPNVTRSLVSEEVARGAAVPVLSHDLAHGQKREAARLAGAVTLWSTVFMALIAAALELTAPWIVALLSSGAIAVPAEQRVTARLLEIMLLMVVLNGAVAAPSALLIARRRFGVAAAAAAATSLPMIALLVLRPRTSIESVAWAAVAGFALQGAWQLVAVHRSGGMPITVRARGLTTVGRLALPVAAALGAATVSGLVDVAFSALTGSAGPAALDKAFRLMLLPYGVLVVAIGVVALPNLVESAGRIDAFQFELGRALNLILVLVIPAALLLLAIPHELVVTAYQRGSFDQESTAITARALRGTAAVLPALALSMIGARAWLSRQRPWPAAAVAGSAAVGNVVLDWALVGPMGLVGICLATAIVHLVAGGLLILSSVSRPRALLSAVGNTVLRAGGAATFAVGIPAALSQLLSLSELATVILVVAGSVPLYVFAARVLGLNEVAEILRAFRSRIPS